ncbi:MAG: galactokinase [Clostridia bacterium]|nr:galactokinase [Clostridia bacterium]
MTVSSLKNAVQNGTLHADYTARCGVNAADADSQDARVLSAIDAFADRYGAERDVMLLSVGGRSELSGNHTDHNHGRVIAASISLDVLAVAAKRDDGVMSVASAGYPVDTVEAAAIDAPDAAKFFKSSAIIAGMARAFRDAGYEIGGFDAATTSNVLKGSGLSSSAAFEVMIGNILNYLYNDGKVSNVEIAKMAQYAENMYFGKPCGLMDQTACAVGGCVTIDFADPKTPVIEKLPLDLAKAGYALCITDTGGNHADLNDDYASVPAEMKAVAALLGKTVLREVTREDVIANAARIRENCGDRAFLRAMHFLSENTRVGAQADALRTGDIDAFFSGVLASGASSYRYLQNVYTTKNVAEQGLSVALCMTELFITETCGSKGAWRVHGGGFAGTVQAYVPVEYAKQYVSFMENVFGEGAVYVLNVRPEGAIRLA